jgi:hypothetical protein
MKITKQYLKQVIKEELKKVLEEGPITMKIGIADYGKEGGLEDLQYMRGEKEMTKELDDTLVRMIGYNKNSTQAEKTIKKYGFQSGFSLPYGLMLYVIASKHKAGGAEFVYDLYKEKIEDEDFNAQDYLDSGVNKEKLLELYPKLFKELEKKDTPY